VALDRALISHNPTKMRPDPSRSHAVLPASPQALLSQLSSGMASGFNALAAAAEAELKRTNSDLQRATSCGSLGDSRATSSSNLSSSTAHTVLLAFGAGPATVKREGGSQDSSTSDTASVPSVGEEVDHAKLRAAADQRQRLADLVAADQRIFAGDEGCDEEEAARIEAEAEAAQVA
jgi:hypothetical protein